MRRSSAGKSSRTSHSSSTELVTMERGDRQFVCHLYGTPASNMPGFTSSERATGLWRCCCQPEMLWNYLVAGRQGTYRCRISHRNPCLEEGIRRHTSCVAKIAPPPPIPDACLELVTCGCKSKCKTAGSSCFRKNLKCTSACGCELIHCCNPAGQQSHITCI